MKSIASDPLPTGLFSATSRPPLSADSDESHPRNPDFDLPHSPKLVGLNSSSPSSHSLESGFPSLVCFVFPFCLTRDPCPTALPRMFSGGTKVPEPSFDILIVEGIPIHGVPFWCGQRLRITFRFASPCRFLVHGFPFTNRDLALTPICKRCANNHRAKITPNSKTYG
jgi:hypothetical protein